VANFGDSLRRLFPIQHITSLMQSCRFFRHAAHTSSTSQGRAASLLTAAIHARRRRVSVVSPVVRRSPLCCVDTDQATRIDVGQNYVAVTLRIPMYWAYLSRAPSRPRVYFPRTRPLNMRPDRLEAASSLDSVHYFMLTGEQ